MDHCVFGSSNEFKRYKNCTILFINNSSFISEYPSKRSAKATDGSLEGVAGNLKMIHEVGVAEQPITSFNWNADKLGLAASTSFDQTLRILAVTKLNCL